MEKPSGPAFDPDDLGDVLASPAQPRLDSVHGQGYHYHLGDPNYPQSDLEIYPDAKLVRYSSEGLQITMTDEELGARYTNGTVIFHAESEREIRHMTVSGSGNLLLAVTSTNTDYSLPIEELPNDTQAAEEQKERQEKVNLMGRAGRDAQLRETKSGKKISKFPLAVHDQNEEGKDLTTWETIVAFNSLAETVSETVKKGKEYKVVGFLHETEKDGKTTREIYAVNVKEKSAPAPPQR